MSLLGAPVWFDTIFLYVIIIHNKSALFYSQLSPYPIKIIASCKRQPNMSEFPYPSTQETVLRLQNLLRINTINPPGNEDVAAAYLKQQFSEAGIENAIVEPFPRRASIWARLKGNGKKKPLLLVSHLDVVPVEQEKWKVDPFGGEIIDSMIYGRGAIDMKQMTAMQVTLLLYFAQLQKEHQYILDRDLIFLAVADEECGGDAGMQWIIQNKPEWIAAEFALNEGGGSGVQLGAKRIYPCEAAQKGPFPVTLRVTGEPGHGSIPHQNNALAILSRAVHRVAAKPLPLHITNTSRQFFARIAQTQRQPQQQLLRLATNPVLANSVHAVLPDQNLANVFRAMTHNTASPTVMRAGQAHNVIPSEASVLLDCRLIPGQNQNDIKRELRERIRDPRVHIEVGDGLPGYEFSSKTPVFAAIERAIAQEDSEGAVAPYLFPAVSDSRFLARAGVTCYGFIPHKPEAGVPPIQLLAHGHDERISIANVEFGLRVLFRTLLEMQADS